MQRQNPDRDHNLEQPNHRDTKAVMGWRKGITYLSLVLFGAGASFGGSYLASHNELPLQASKTIAAIPPLAATDRNFITDVVDKVGPAVVRINSTKTVTSQVPDALKDPFFRQFFGSQVPVPQEKQVERGTGSGFIINSNGEILTNAHVVNGADKVTVTLKDGRTFPGKVLGTDSVTDVAVVKIDANNLPTVSLGNSDQLKAGEWAIAIGNPLGLDNTVTSGIISATGRTSSEVGVPAERVSFIQTDAAINPGNSGGPLLNATGQVVGMNTAIIQGAQGLGFAIPINTAKTIANQLISKGKVEHAYLGIQMTTLTPELKQTINSDPNSGLSVDDDRGVLVIKVMPTSPAAKAGVRRGDVIQQINGQPVKDANSLQQSVEKSQVGGNLQMELHRNGQTLNLTVHPGVLPAQQPS